MNKQRQEQILQFIEQARNVVNYELRHPASRPDEYYGIWTDDLMSSAGPIENLQDVDRLLETISKMIDFEDEQSIDET